MAPQNGAIFFTIIFLSMSNHCELTIHTQNADQREQIIAMLANIGFEAFEETEETLKAFITEDAFVEADCLFLNEIYAVKYSKSIINKQNWNQLWESNFEPVQVDDFVGIRAGFHAPFQNMEHEITITPKMSFGTGHHATTYTVMQMMRNMNFAGKKVLDFGTGTGILAILAEKLGAYRVLGTDNDEWCIENASENISINGCKAIDIELVDINSIDEKFDIILANINKHILLENCQAILRLLLPGGQLLLSGLLAEDEMAIRNAFTAAGFQYGETNHRKGWIAISFTVKTGSIN